MTALRPFKVCENLKATHRPHSWDAYFDVFAEIGNIMGVKSSTNYLNMIH